MPDKEGCYGDHQSVSERETLCELLPSHTPKGENTLRRRESEQEEDFGGFFFCLLSIVTCL